MTRRIHESRRGGIELPGLQRHAGAVVKKHMKLKWEGIGQFGDCPICGQAQAVNASMPWCSGCGTEYGRICHRATYSYVVFDTLKKTPRFAFAKALNLSGGMRFGTVVKSGKP